jgi:hypothetical protein
MDGARESLVLSFARRINDQPGTQLPELRQQQQVGTTSPRRWVSYHATIPVVPAKSTSLV